MFCWYFRTVYLSSFRADSVNIRIRNHLNFKAIFNIILFIILEIRKYLNSLCFKRPGVTNFGIFANPYKSQSVYWCRRRRRCAMKSVHASTDRISWRLYRNGHWNRSQQRLFSRKSAVLQREREDWSHKDVLLDTEAWRANTSFERQSGTPLIMVSTGSQQASNNGSAKCPEGQVAGHQKWPLFPILEGGGIR